MNLDEMVVSQINLRIDDVHNRQDSTDGIVEKMRTENADFNSQIVTAVNDQTVAFSEVKTKQTIYVSIAVFVITFVLNFGLDSAKSHTETEKKKYYDKRVANASATQQMQDEINALTKMLNTELLKNKGIQ